MSGSTGSYRPGKRSYFWKQQKVEYCIGKTETFGGTEMFKGLDTEESGDDLREGYSIWKENELKKTFWVVLKYPICHPFLLKTNSLQQNYINYETGKLWIFYIVKVILQVCLLVANDKKLINK